MTAFVPRALPVRSDPLRSGSTPFGDLLRDVRERRGLSQTKMADRADMDHSYASRLESGSRLPSRDAVGRLADALHLSVTERSRLFAAAFGLDDLSEVLNSEPAIGEVLTLLRDAAISEERKDALRQQLTLSVRLARMGA